MTIRDHISELYEDILFADGFDDAIFGVVTQFNNVTVCYDRERSIRILMERDGMTHEDAEEFFEFNVTGSYVGEKTPCSLEKVNL